MKLFCYRVDTLFIATPPDIYPYVGIGSGGASGVEEEQARHQMQGEPEQKLLSNLCVIKITF